MLFLALNSLFSSVDAALAGLARAVGAGPLPEAAGGLAEAGRVGRLLDRRLGGDDGDLLGFLLRLEVFRDLFNLCSRVTLCFKAEPGSYSQSVPTSDEMARPIKHFQAEYLRKRVAGLAGHALTSFLCEYTGRVDSWSLEGAGGDLAAAAQSFLAHQRRGQAAKGDKTHFYDLELDNLQKLVRKSEVAKCLQHSLAALGRVHGGETIQLRRYLQCS